MVTVAIANAIALVIKNRTSKLTNGIKSLPPLHPGNTRGLEDMEAGADF